MTSRFPSALRTTILAVVTLLALTACGGSDSGAADQGLTKVAAQAGWTTTKLDGITISAPHEWTKGKTTQATPTMKSTVWRAAAVAGTAPGGMEVRVISKPQQNAKKAALALSISASASLNAGKIDPEKIVWPRAKSAYFYATVITAGPTGKESKFSSATVVFDLPDGRQIQVTSLARQGTKQAEPTTVLGTIRLPAN